MLVSKQTTECLYRPDSNSYCCLGVLTQCYLDETGNSWEVFNNGTNKDEDFDEAMDELVYGWEECLPPEVIKWAGLDYKDPTVKINEALPAPSTQTLSQLNDGGYTFTQIAKLIEEQL